MDIEVKGCRFTWASNPRNGFITKEKIDRLLANWSWQQTFPNASVSANPPVSSYHSPLILCLKPKVGDGGRFKYELFWEEHQQCNEIISEGWNLQPEEGDPWQNFLNKSKACKRKLTS